MTFSSKHKDFFNNKNIAIDNLKYYNLFFRDLFIYQKTKNNSDINFIHYQKEIFKIHEQYPLVNWKECIIATNNTQKYLSKNGNPSLLIISLFLEYTKIINKNYYNVNILEDWLNYPV